MTNHDNIDPFPVLSVPPEDKRENDPWEMVEKTTRMFSGKVFAADVLDVKLHTGHTSKREIVRHNGGAAILPLDKDMNVYAVRQFRAPFMQVLTEIPAGKLETGEDPKEAAIRELSEETGFVAEQVIDLGTIYPSPGYCAETLHLFLAIGLKEGESHPDPGEELYVEKIPLTILLEKIEKNEIHDAKTVVAVLKTARRMNL